MNQIIYAIVVTYNALRWVDKCLGSLQTSSVPVHTIVIDNASGDNTVAYIRDKFPDVHLIESKINLGFAKANNIGIKHALDQGADYIFLLNQDAWVEEDTLSVLPGNFEEQPALGIVSPLHLNGDKSGLDWMFIDYMPTEFTSDLYFNRFKSFYHLPFVNAAAWLISTSCINRVGGFDTSLFTHYGEDTNYCQRVLYHGFEIGINTKCTICHDREFRKNGESEYRNQIFADEQRWRKIELGNINLELDIDTLIAKNKLSVRKATFKLLLKKAARHKQEIEFLMQIKRSRELNKKGGLVWL